MATLKTSPEANYDRRTDTTRTKRLIGARATALPKNDRNGGVWQSGISKSLAEYVQRPVCFVNVQLSLHENVVFSVCALMDNAAYNIFIMWNSISGLDTCYHFRLNISCGVAVTVRSHQKLESICRYLHLNYKQSTSHLQERTSLLRECSSSL